MTFPSKRVVFFSVRDNGAKVKALCDTAQLHFSKKEPIFILVEDLKTEQFVDELLWKAPQASFLPHVISETDTHEWVVISKLKKNLNQAKAAFNLCPTPLLFDGPFKIIYEFEDLSSQSKKNLSSLRLDAYQKAGWTVEAR